MNSELLPDYTFDAIDLTCPLPLIKAKSFFSRLLPGQTLSITRVHLSQVADFEHWCGRTGQSVQIQKTTSTEHFDILIKKI